MRWVVFLLKDILIDFVSNDLVTVSFAPLDHLGDLFGSDGKSQSRVLFKKLIVFGLVVGETLGLARHELFSTKVIFNHEINLLLHPCSSLRDGGGSEVHAGEYEAFQVVLIFQGIGQSEDGSP